MTSLFLCFLSLNAVDPTGGLFCFTLVPGFFPYGVFRFENPVLSEG